MHGVHGLNNARIDVPTIRETSAIIADDRKGRSRAFDSTGRFNSRWPP